MDPTNAYPKKELQKWRRHVVLEKPNITIVLDEIHTPKNSNIEVRFHSGVDLNINNGAVLLKGNKGSMALIPVTDQDYSIKKGRHPSQMVNATQPFNWIDYFDVEITAQSKKTIVAKAMPHANTACAT